MIIAFATVATLISAQLDPAEVAVRVQQVYDQAQALRCEFRQLYRSGATGKITEESGFLLLSKPGRMRWEYQNPERKLYISDGQTVYWYLPADRQVTKMSLEEADQEQAQILFLMGRGNLERDFNVTGETATEPLYEGSYMLRLAPRREENFDYLIMEVIPRDFLVVRMIVVDPFGNSTDYRFANIHPEAVDDENFRFEIPRGVEVFESQ